jgi:hypothetical protein
MPRRETYPQAKISSLGIAFPWQSRPIQAKSLKYMKFKTGTVFAIYLADTKVPRRPVNVPQM